MIFDVGDPWAVLASSATWLVVSLVVGHRAVRWRAASLDAPGPLTTIRAWERHGSSWQRTLRVSRWKDRVPEAGGFFAGGIPKRRLASRASSHLRQVRRETVRAERVHWIILASTPVHGLWCRPAIAAGMVVFAVGFNAPFIVIQRYNRARLDRLLGRRSARGSDR